MKNILIYILGFIIPLIFGIDNIVSSYRSIATIVLGIIFLICALFILVIFIFSLIVSRLQTNIIIENKKFIIFPIDSTEMIELNDDEIESIELFVLPILNAGYKQTKDYNNQIKIKTEDKSYIVYCANKEELKDFLEKNYKDKIAK